jgi:thiol-disulfide isomerase/thioredoxin
VKVSTRIEKLLLVFIFLFTKAQAQDIQTVSLYNFIPDTATRRQLNFEYLNAANYNALPPSLQISSRRVDSLYHTKSDRFYKIYLVAPEQRALLDFIRYHDTSLFTKQIRTFAIDTAKWSRRPIANLVYIQVSKLENNRYIIIVDANNNYSFQDDSAYFTNPLPDPVQNEEPPISEFDSLPLSNIEFYYGTSYRLGMIAGISMQIFQRNISKGDSISLAFIDENFKEGHINSNGLNADVVIRPSWLSGVNFDKLSEITLLSQSNRYIPGKNYVHLGDTAYIDNSKILIKGLSVDGHSLSFKSLSTDDLVIYGPQVGNTAHDFILPDNTGKTYEPSRDSKGKYVLLDFWGTWCHPCLDNIPALKKFYLESSIASTVDFIGVCVDDLSDKEALLNKIGKIDIPWRSVLVDRNDSYSDNTSIVGLYKITAYPTYIIIGPDGRILSRYIGEDQLPQLIQDLSKLAASHKS